MTYDRFPMRDNMKNRIESPAKGISEDRNLERHADTLATFAGFFARIFYNLWNSGTMKD